MSAIFYYGALAQLARAPALHAGGQGFDSPRLHHSNGIATLGCCAETVDIYLLWQMCGGFIALNREKSLFDNSKEYFSFLMCDKTNMQMLVFVFLNS